MAKKIQFNVNLNNRVFYSLIAVMSFILIALAGIFVMAYNPTGSAEPSVMGHSANEIEGVCRSDGTNCPPLSSIPSGAVLAFNLASCPSGWTEVAKGRVIVGLDTSQSEFNSLGKTGGEKTHTLNVSEMPSHEHDLGAESGSPGCLGRAWGNSACTPAGNYDTGSIGGDQPHNNLQPYIVFRYCQAP